MSALPSSPVRRVIDPQFPLPGHQTPRVLLDCGHALAQTLDDPQDRTPRACWKCRAGQPADARLHARGA